MLRTFVVICFISYFFRLVRQAKTQGLRWGGFVGISGNFGISRSDGPLDPGLISKESTHSEANIGNGASLGVSLTGDSDPCTPFYTEPVTGGGLGFKPGFGYGLGMGVGKSNTSTYTSKPLREYVPRFVRDFF